MTLPPPPQSERASTRRREQYTCSRVCSRPFALAQLAIHRELSLHHVLLTPAACGNVARTAGKARKADGSQRAPALQKKNNKDRRALRRRRRRSSSSSRRVQRGNEVGGEGGGAEGKTRSRPNELEALCTQRGQPYPHRSEERRSITIERCNGPPSCFGRVLASFVYGSKGHTPMSARLH